MNTEIAEKIKNMLVENLRIPADELEYTSELFGDDIGLDSIDSRYRQPVRRTDDRRCKRELPDHRDPHKVR